MHRGEISPLQGTVTRTIRFAGIGLHSGKIVELEIQPTAPNTGITFVRSDSKNSAAILAHPSFISSTLLSTTIGYGESQVATIEHLMAAFSGLGIDNALVKVSANEIPILDGSSAPFVDKLVEAGVQLQNAKRKIIIPREDFEVQHGDQYIRFEPYRDSSDEELVANPRLELECSIDFPSSKVIGYQSARILFSHRTFLDLCEARTFCHIDDVNKMREKGLALGGSLDNAVVVNDERVVNIDGLRYQDEFVRHKLLDCIGDLALLGGRLVGKVKMHKAGHTLHAAFTQKVLRSRCFEYPTTVSQNCGQNVLEGMGLAATKIS